MNILIIEDDQLLRKALGYDLLELGHSVSLANNGQEGLDSIEKKRDIDLIICDVMMPVLTGPAFILMLKKYFPHGRPGIMVISGVREGEEFLKKIEIEYDYFLPKPIDFEKLNQLVSSMAAKNKALGV